MKILISGTFLVLIFYAVNPALSETAAELNNAANADTLTQPLIGIQPIGLAMSNLRLAWLNGKSGSLSMHTSSSLTEELHKCGLEKTTVTAEEEVQDHPTKKYMLASAKKKGNFRNNEDYFLRFALTKETELVTSTEGGGSLEMQLIGTITSAHSGKTKLLYSERLRDYRLRLGPAVSESLILCIKAPCTSDPTQRPIPTDPQTFGASLQTLSSTAASQLGRKACKYIQNDFRRAATRRAAGDKAERQGL